VLVDLGGRVLHHEVSAGAVTARTLVKRLQKACEALVQRARQLGIRLLGIGCGVPGIVDPQRGVLLQSIPLGVEDEVRLVERLQPALARPVYLDNDAHSCCWGELTAGAAASDSFLFILGEWRRAPQRVGALLTAIGMGLVIDRQVRYGRGYSAGEFRSSSWQPGNTSQFSLRDDEIAAAHDDPELRARLVRELARTAAMIVHILDLDRLYLGGFFDPRDVETQAVFTEEIRRNWTYPTPPRCEVSFATHGEQAVAYGGAGMLLARAFAEPAVFEAREDGLALLLGS
jgi:predicted NBD/HSP70 family sugar kinase